MRWGFCVGMESHIPWMLMIAHAIINVFVTTSVLALTFGQEPGREVQSPEPSP